MTSTQADIRAPKAMTVRRSLMRSMVFALVYVLATFVGRLTVMDGTNLSMVWPAAGVLVLWFCAQRQARARWADVAALVVITLLVNKATGASGRLAVVFVAANLGQIALFMWLFRCWQPSLWGAGGRRGLTRLRDLWVLLGAATISTGLGASIGTGGMWLITGHVSWSSYAVWLARNTASVLLIGAVGLRIGYVWHTRTRGTGWTTRARWARTMWQGTAWWRVAEYTALISCSALAYWLTFAVAHGLPVAFLLIAVTVWAAMRTPTTFVVVHDLIVGTIAVLFTLHGTGSFAAIGDNAVRALVAQLFVAVVAVTGLALALGRDERQTLLEQLAADKAELAVQKDHAQRHGKLMNAIIDSMADGLAVIDADGRVLLRNAACERLLGGRTSPGDRITDTAYYGLLRPDGSILPDNETAYARIIAGEHHAHQDVLVRNPGLSETRIVSVTGTRLEDDNGAVRAVVLVHDVTAERRHRDELAAFAGVVAHDLQNPLTAVQGWNEAAAEALLQVPRHPHLAEAESSLLRAQRAGTRMRVLIDDLLDYATARDAAVRLISVDLEQVVTDIAAARADAAVAAGAPIPRFDIAALPAVQADPPLLRQLLDNLIGNAIKYTAAGTIPAIEITANEQDGRIAVTITDNGIGIPDGHHDAIFGNFHRAHPHQPYAGTGLGLTICKRIVHRHGGTIIATDNPTGGTHFTFTLPAAHRIDTPTISTQPVTSVRR